MCVCVCVFTESLLLSSLRVLINDSSVRLKWVFDFQLVSVNLRKYKAHFLDSDAVCRYQEEELRQSGEAKYHHLNEDLHVLIEVFAPPAEAYARMGHALEEIKKFLIPVRKHTLHLHLLGPARLERSLGATAGRRAVNLSPN